MNYEKLYHDLKKEQKKLKNAIEQYREVDTSLPEDFNHNGWKQTLDAVAELHQKIAHAMNLNLIVDESGNVVGQKRLTPQFFRSVYHRAVVASAELDKIIKRLTPDVEEVVENYELACMKLMQENSALKEQLSALSQKEPS